MKDIPKETHVSRKMGGNIFVRTISLLIYKLDAILADDDNKKPLIRGFPKAVTLVLCYLLVPLDQYCI